jgi:hypothetical protein
VSTVAQGDRYYESSDKLRIFFDVHLTNILIEKLISGQNKQSILTQRMPSSVLLRRVALARTKVSEELIASIIRLPMYI